MSSFRTQSIVHVLLQHQGFKNSRQNRRSRFQQTPKVFRSDFQQNCTVTRDGRGAPDTALQHRLLTERVTFEQSCKNNAAVFVSDFNTARFNEVQRVSVFAGPRARMNCYTPQCGSDE